MRSFLSGSRDFSVSSLNRYASISTSTYMCIAYAENKKIFDTRVIFITRLYEKTAGQSEIYIVEVSAKIIVVKNKITYSS